MVSSNTLAPPQPKLRRPEDSSLQAIPGLKITLQPILHYVTPVQERAAAARGTAIEAEHVAAQTTPRKSRRPLPAESRQLGDSGSRLVMSRCAHKRFVVTASGAPLGGPDSQAATMEKPQRLCNRGGDFQPLGFRGAGEGIMDAQGSESLAKLHVLGKQRAASGVQCGFHDQTVPE